LCDDLLCDSGAYLPALRGSTLRDDDGHLTKSGLQSLHGLLRIWFELGANQQYYPLLHGVFWLEHRMRGAGRKARPYRDHLTNTALHALSACLVVMINELCETVGSLLNLAQYSDNFNHWQ
jgi:hypothetical protein